MKNKNSNKWTFYSKKAAMRTRHHIILKKIFKGHRTELQKKIILPSCFMIGYKVKIDIKIEKVIII